jgi:hypothetical protein
VISALSTSNGETQMPETLNMSSAAAAERVAAVGVAVYLSPVRVQWP